MASSVIGALRVNLGLDSAQFSRGMTDAQKRLKVARAQFLAVAGAAAAFGTALTAAAIKGARDIDRLATTARSLDATVASMQSLQIAASEVGLEGLDGALVRLNRRLGAAEFGGGAAAVTVRALNLDLKALSEMDADERVAHLADALKDSGMSMQQVARHAQNLGFEQAQAAEFFAQGGDAIRAARARLDEYGLSVSQIDAKKVSDAAGQLGDLGLISQYVTQRLAIELVPALGAMAQAMTDSLKAGGLLRAMIDGLVVSLGPVSRAVASLTVFMGARYVAALVAARLATMTLSGALVFLRGAIIRTGFGALIVAAGELVYWFGKLVKAAGGFGNAIEMVGDLFVAVWNGITTTAGSLIDEFRAISMEVQGIWASLMAYLANKWSGFLSSIAPAYNAFAETVGAQSLDAIGAASYASYLENTAVNLGTRAEGYRTSARAARAGAWDGVREAAAAMSAAVSDTNDAFDAGADTANDYADALDNVAESAGGVGQGGEGGAGTALEPLIEDARTLSDVMGDVRETFKEAFVGLVTGAKNLSDAIGDLLKKFADMLANRAFDMLWEAMFPTGGGAAGGGIGGFSRGLIGSNATGTNNWRGGLTSVNERGGEIMNLPRGTQIIPHDISKRMADGSGTTLEVHIHENATDGQTQVKQSGGRIDVLLRRELSDMVRGGGLDGAIGQRFGMRPRAAGG